MPSPTSSPRPHVVELVNERSAIDRVLNEVTDAAAAMGYSKASRFAVRLSMEEAISNAFRHGHKGLPGQTPITVTYDVNEQEITITVEDRGPGYRPQDVPDPTLDANLEQLSGRGMMLIRAYMARVEHNAKGNRLEMTYRKPA
jgi:serine/threonine-protein kinase RsbW